MTRVIKLFCLVCFILIRFNYVYSSDDNITASHFKDKVDSLAKLIDSSSKPLFVKSDSVDLNGTSKYWIYIYTSLDSSVYYYFHTNLNFVTFDSISNIILAGPGAITKNWIDSDSAMFLAELHGGSDFRALNPNYSIQAFLGQGLIPPTLPEWFIRYVSNENPDSTKLIIIDATKEDPPTQIPSMKDNQYLPQKFTLYQNFPNPFNSTTQIKFDIPQYCKVVLKVYNLVGQEMETLMNDFQPKGRYEVKWQLNELPSGIYFYQIQVGKEMKISKMTLLR